MTIIEETSTKPISELVNTKYKALVYLKDKGVDIPRVYGSVPIGRLIHKFGGNLPERICFRSSTPGGTSGLDGVFDSPSEIFANESTIESCCSERLDPENVFENYEVIVQERLPYAVRGRMYAHPHNPNKLFIAYELSRSEIISLKNVQASFYDYMVNRWTSEYNGMGMVIIKTNKIYKHHNAGKDHKDSMRKEQGFLERRFIKQIFQIVKEYRDITKLEAFQDDWSWELEFGFLDDKLNGKESIHWLDAKRFRPHQEPAEWVLNPENYKNSLVIPEVIGITAKEGHEVNYLMLGMGMDENKIVETIKASNHSNLLVLENEILLSMLSAKISATQVREYGLTNHNEIANARNIPLILHVNGIHQWIWDKSGEGKLKQGAICPFKIYSDGRMGVIERI